MTLPRLSLCTAMVLTALSTLNAQSVATAPVGAVTTSLSTGFSLVGLTLVNPSSFSGAVVSNTSTQITTEASINFQTLLSQQDFYYVEITSGIYEGDRFDIDTAATVAVPGSNLIIRTDTGNNTVALSEGALNGASLVVRKHITLDSLTGSVSPAFVGNNSSTSADQVLFYNRATSAFDTYFLRGDNITWRKVGATTSVGASTIIPPGVGVFIRKANSSSILTQIGEVRSNNFALPVGSGLSLFAAGYPVGYSPAALGGTSTNGWVGNNSSTSADQIITYSTASSSYLTYFLRGDGLAWRQVGSTTDVKNVEVVSFDSAFWFKRANADVNNVLPAPVF